MKLSETEQAKDMVFDATALVFQAAAQNATLNLIGNNRAWGNAPDLLRSIAGRVLDEEQLQWCARLLSLGIDVTEVKDRHYFRSIYFRDPMHTGGILFEIATDGPGFTADESLEALGTTLKLPPRLEARRERIEERLPALATG